MQQTFCASLKNIFSFRVAEIDTTTFRLHYKVTFVVLLFLSVLVGWRQHFEVAISCVSGNDIFSRVYLDNYCYTHSTHSYVESFNKTVGREIPYPGLDKYSPSYTKIYQTYYQWVSIVLFAQSILFLLPRCFWKLAESGRLEEIVKELSNPEVVKESFHGQNLIKSTENSKLLLRSELKCNSGYFASYVVAEVLNLVNVVGQFCLMNVFLGGHFFSYGHQVLQLTGLLEPGFKLFPGVARCNIHIYGSSGDVQRHDAMCLLPINALNSKIYAFLWFWFIFLGVVSCFVLICLLAFFLTPKFRVASISSGKRILEKESLENLVFQISASDCFLLYLISRNVSSIKFKEIVSGLAKGDCTKNLSDDESTLM